MMSVIANSFGQRINLKKIESATIVPFSFVELIDVAPEQFEQLKRILDERTHKAK